LYPIRTIAEITGINPVTLRAWERRYGLIEPERTPKGHRLYTDEHIERIRRILDLVERGVAIGQVKRMLESEADEPMSGEVEAGQDPWDSYRQQLMRAVRRFDEAGLEAVYDDCLSLFPFELSLRLLLLPLLQELRDHRGKQNTGSAEAAFLHSFLRNKIGVRFHHLAGQTHGERLLLSCVPGEVSDLELLLFAVVAATRGYRAVLLGPGVPLDQLPLAAATARVRAILLFVSEEPTPHLLRTQLPVLAQQSRVPVCVGGTFAAEASEWIDAAGCLALLPGPGEAVRQLDRLLRES